MIGGAELAVKEITDRISDCEFDLICARLRRDLEPAMRFLFSAVKKQEKIGRINVYRVGFGSKIDKLLLPLFGFLKARKIYKKLQVPSPKFQVVLWGLMASWGSAAAWFFKIFYPRVPFLLTLQEGDAERSVSGGRRFLINMGWRLILAKADFVQVISNYLAKMAKKYGYRGEIEVVPNGVDLKMYNVSYIKHNGEKIKSRLKISSNDKIIITVSRLVEKNGIGDLIEAINQFSIFNFQFSIKLLILGGGPLEKSLKFKVSSSKLQDKVLFLGDILNEEVPKYLAIADVFVRPSLSEGLGTAFLEAMAAGVPIVATPVGGIPDFLKDGETGLFCKVKNPKSIAEKMRMLLENDELRSRIITNARKMVEEKYDWNIIASKMAEIFDKW
jgi:glycosyltransferase involved in cell wall biosynthesis